MKRLILMGGRPWPAADGGQAQVEAVLRYYPKKVKLAFCIFAQDESDWAETRQTNMEMIDKFKGSRSIDYKTMTPENFRELSAWADVIYMPGGETAKLKSALDKYADLAELWDDKIIVGASAGANVLCAYYSRFQEKTIKDGFGWVRATIVPHWRNEGEDWDAQDWAEAELLRLHPDLPLLCIPEGDFVEIAVN